MSSIIHVSKAVIERVTPVLPPTDIPWWTSWFTPRTIAQVPALCLKPDDTRHADYQQTTGSSYAKWMLRAELHLDASQEEAAHERISALLDPAGPVIKALRSDDYADPDLQDDLYRLCGLNIAVTDGRRWKSMPGRGRREPRLSADIGIVCGAN